jgi:hypothetical protein
VLELLPGGEFFNYLQSAGKLSEDKSRFYSAAVVLALGELHRNKIAYRDLKPENMVSGGGQLCAHTCSTERFVLNRRHVYRCGFVRVRLNCRSWTRRAT